jgi:hypothetical protein
MAGRPIPGALNIGDGGGKGESRHLGCGLEKRPPYPRLSKLGDDAPRLGAGSFTGTGVLTGKSKREDDRFNLPVCVVLGLNWGNTLKCRPDGRESARF